MELVPVGGGGDFPFEQPFLNGSEGNVTQSDLPQTGLVEAETVVIESGASITISDTLYLFATDRIEIRENAVINGHGNGSDAGSNGWGTRGDGSPGEPGLMGGAGGTGGWGGTAGVGADAGMGGDGGDAGPVTQNELEAYYSLAIASTFTDVPSLGGAGGGGGGGGGAQVGSGRRGGDGGSGGAGMLLCAPEISVSSSALIDLRGEDGDDGQDGATNMNYSSGGGGGGGGGGGDFAAVGRDVTVPENVVQQGGGNGGKGGEVYTDGSRTGMDGYDGTDGEFIVPD